MNVAIDPPALHCPSSHCLHPNPYEQEYCEACNTRLVRRFLRVVGPLHAPPEAGQLLGHRYQWVGSGDDRIVLDTQPGVSPVLVEEVPDRLLPYLRLLPQRLAVPQIYGFVYADDRDLFLLEDVPVIGYVGPRSPTPAPPSPAGQLLPTLQEQWASSSPQRQLGWLWQMSTLWLALSQHKLAATLLNSQLVRVDGPVLRLLELHLVPSSPTLDQLAEVWTTLLPSSDPSIKPFLQKLVTLIKGRDIRYPHPLSQVLHQALIVVNQGRSCEVTIATQTDAGPSRQNNEDSCFPPNLSTVTGQPGGGSLAIVCDGLGGHEGGEVASSMAVQILQDHLGHLSNTQGQQNPLQHIQRAITEANDVISHRNNEEKRQERRRMGTTLVSALTLDPFTYVFHVGDSRAYWVTPHNCRQITVDDDLAARHVSLGFGLYRSVLQSPTSGALVQALGMSASVNLMPNITPFFLDEDALLMLCSDGLSDNDLVERIWDAVLLPGLETPPALGTLCQELVQMANTFNGHDNVTVALIRYQFQPAPAVEPSTLLALLNPSTLNPQDLLTEPMQGRGLADFGDEEEVTGFTPKSSANTTPKTMTPGQVPESASLDPQAVTAPEKALPKPLSPLMWIWGLMVLTIAGAVVGAMLFAPFFNLNDPDPLGSPLPSPEALPTVAPEVTPRNEAPANSDESTPGEGLGTPAGSTADPTADPIADPASAPSPSPEAVLTPTEIIAPAPSPNGN